MIQLVQNTPARSVSKEFMDWSFYVSCREELDGWEERRSAFVNFDMSCC